MASAPQPQLPLFYKDLMPLNSRDHGDWKVSPFDDASFMKDTHAIPLTVDEFVDAQRNYPIVFTAGDNPLPIALFGLNEGVNTYISAEDGIRDYYASRGLGDVYKRQVSASSSRSFFSSTMRKPR